MAICILKTSVLHQIPTYLKHLENRLPRRAYALLAMTGHFGNKILGGSKQFEKHLFDFISNLMVGADTSIIHDSPFTSSVVPRANIWVYSVIMSNFVYHPLKFPQ